MQINGINCNKLAVKLHFMPYFEKFTPYNDSSAQRSDERTADRTQKVVCDAPSLQFIPTRPRSKHVAKMMKLATLLAILIVCCTCIASIEAVVETYTKSFQHGVDGWWGGASIDISEGQMGPGPVGSWNQDGTTYADGVRNLIKIDFCENFGI